MGKFTLVAASAAALFAAGATVTARRRGDGEVQRRQLLQGHERVQDVARLPARARIPARASAGDQTSSEQECTAKGGKVL